jgi:NDP-sugar pyrophosphorylase family protein
VADLTTALVLTAGLGTRLRPLTLVRAKPAIPIAGTPIVRRILQSLADGGVTEVVLNLHHLPSTISAVVGDGSDLGLRARYSWEQPVVLGSAGGPRLALPIVAAETFFVVNGDTLTDFDPQLLARAHEASGAEVTLALTPNLEPLRYGGVMLNEQGNVTGFARRGPEAAGSFHFVGVQVVNARAIEWLPVGEPFNSIGYAYDRLVREFPGSIKGLVVKTGFWDIGTIADYMDTHRHFAAVEHPSHRGARIGTGAQVTSSILWDSIEVGDGATVEECIVTDGVRIPPGSTYRRAILIAGESALTTISLDQQF